VSSIIKWVLSRKIFIYRSTIFGIAILALIIGKDFSMKLFNFTIAGPVKVFHLLWAFMMFEMVLVFISKLNHFNGCGKVYKKNYIPIKHNKDDLKAYTKKFNLKALYSAIIWIGLIAIMSVFRNNKVVLIMISITFYFLDQLFVNIWCPFKSWIIGNRCCATCRIYNWGFPMAVSPLIYIRSFWSFSLVLVSIIMLIHWEYLHYKYPERFSEVSNQTLLCKNCNDKCKNFKKIISK